MSGLAKNELPSAFVMAGLDHSRSKNGVASLAYAIPLRDAASPRSSKSEGGCPPDRDHRVKPGDDAEFGERQRAATKLIFVPLFRTFTEAKSVDTACGCREPLQ